jgi:hypothetical protein
LERALRECLARRAAVTSAPPDELADAAIRRARGARRRQAGASALAVAVLAAVAGGAVVRLTPASGSPESEFVAPDPPARALATDSPATTAAPTASPAGAPEPVAISTDVPRNLMADQALPIDVVVEDRLLTAAGSWIDLTGVGGVDAAYRITGGWLVLGRPAALWFASANASPRRLLTDIDAIAVAPDGSQVAWRAGTRLGLGSFAQGRLLPSVSAPAPAGASPVAFVGDGILLTREATGEETGSYAVWWPGRGATALRWRDSTGAYGALPDGRTVVAQVSGAADGQPCLALLDALADLTVLARACDLPLIAGAVGWLSPDGRWLVAEGAVDASVLIDVANAFGEREPAVNAGPGPYGPGVWTDPRTVVHGGPGYLVRLRLDRAAAGAPDAVERIPVAGGGSRPVLPVPRLVD